MLNNVQLQGRVAFTNYKPATGDKKAFISFCVSWQSPEKEEGSNYYKEKLFRCKAFGNTADFIANNFPDKSQILVEAKMDIAKDYTDSNGNMQKGGVELMVQAVHFVGYKENHNNDSHNNATPVSAPKAPAAPAPTPKRPAAPGVPSPKRPAPAPALPRR